MANLGNTIINGALRVNGKINASDVISAPSFVGALTGNASSATNVQSTLSNPTSELTYYIPFHPDVGTGAKALRNNDGFRYVTLEGTTSARGYGVLSVGNNIATGTAGNKTGYIRIYNDNTGFTSIIGTASSSNYTITLPAANGTVSLNGHTHSYLPLSGGTLSGAVNFANATLNKVGDDVSIGDINQAGKLGIKGLNGATGIYFQPYSGSTAQSISIDGAGAMTISGKVKSTFEGNLTGAATKATQDSDGNAINTTYLKKVGNQTISGTITFADGEGTSTKEGGEIHLAAKSTETTLAGTIIDNNNGQTRIFGIPSADGKSKVGAGTPLVIDPYAKTITGGYTITGNLSGNAATATKLATARTIALGGIITGSTTFDGSGNKTITTTIDGFSTVQTITKSMKLTTAWQDTGILTGHLSAGSGSYLVQVTINNGSASGYYNEYWTGVMSVCSANTNSVDSSEVVLHNNGHATNGNTIFLRVIKQSGSSASSKIQISDTHAWASATDITFKFRRLI